MMTRKLIDTRGLEAALDTFAKARDWERFHSPKNLAMALTAEVGELVELFQWLTEEESSRVTEDSRSAQNLKDELADCAIYLVRLASVLGVDLNDAIAQKMGKNALKYPTI